MADLSVVIPTYNRSRLVCEAVESVLSQETRRTLEIIVVDDGSTDNTAELLQRYSDRIQYIRQENSGVNAARNKAIRLTKGKLIALLDSDDVWLPFKTELQLDVLDRYPEAGFVFSNFYIWNGVDRRADGLGTWEVEGKSMRLSFTGTIDGRDLKLAEAHHDTRVSLSDIYELSLYRPVVLPSTAIFRRSLLESLEGFPEDNWMCGDWEFFARACKVSPAVYVDEETALNRSHDDGVRLMRRKLEDRTRLRVESIRRVWKSDPLFMSANKEEVLRVEANELTTLFKEACVRGDREAARNYLRSIREALRGPQHKWNFWYMATAFPPLRAIISGLRDRQ